MAPKRSTKRGMQDATPATKRTRAERDAPLEAVAEAVARAGLPEPCRQMLVVSLPYCFSAPGDQQHEAQASVAKMIGEVVNSEQASLQEASDEAARKVVDLEARKAALQAALTEAQGSLAAASQGAQAKAAALAEAAQAALSAEARLRESEEVQRCGEAAALQKKQSRAALETGLGSDLCAIVEGSCEDAAPHFDSLQPLFRDLALDASLASALPSASLKKPSDRSMFDTMVLEELSARMKARIAALTEEVEAGAPALQELAAAVEAARAEIDKTAASHRAAADELAHARAGEGAAQVAVHAAKEGLVSYGPEYAKALLARDQKAAALQEFKLKTVANFQILCDRVSPKAVATVA